MYQNIYCVSYTVCVCISHSDIIYWQYKVQNAVILLCIIHSLLHFDSTNFTVLFFLKFAFKKYICARLQDTIETKM